MSKQFQRTHSVLFICCIELWTKAVRSSDSFFQKHCTPSWSKVESCKPAKSRASQETNPTGIGEKGYPTCICNSYKAPINLLSTGINKLWRCCRHFEFGNVTWSRDDQSDIFRRWIHGYVLCVTSRVGYLIIHGLAPSHLLFEIIHIDKTT